MFIERTDADAETPILWLPDFKNLLISKDLQTGPEERFLFGEALALC